MDALPLPDIPERALPALQHLELVGVDLRSTLPRSWGSPRVLPALRSLSLQLEVQGGLPAWWAHGFLLLESLVLAGRLHAPQQQAGGAAGLPHAPPAAHQALPPGWVGGFPRLQSVVVAGLGLTGAWPDAWLQPGSFPVLTTLCVAGRGYGQTCLAGGGAVLAGCLGLHAATRLLLHHACPMLRSSLCPLVSPPAVCQETARQRPDRHAAAPFLRCAPPSRRAVCACPSGRAKSALVRLRGWLHGCLAGSIPTLCNMLGSPLPAAVFQQLLWQPSTRLGWLSGVQAPFRPPSPARVAGVPSGCRLHVNSAGCASLRICLYADVVLLCTTHSGVLRAACGPGLPQVDFLELGGNQLTGPAIPPAWLDGSMPNLRLLHLSNNSALYGTLPPSLPTRFPRIVSL